MRIIKAREICLEKLRETIFLLSDAIERKVKDQESGLIKSACEFLQHIRVLTVNAVE